MYIISIFDYFKIFKKNIYIFNHVPSFRRVFLWEINNSFIQNKNTQQSTHKVA